MHKVCFIYIVESKSATTSPPVLPVTPPIPNPPWEDPPGHPGLMPSPIRECFGLHCRMYCCAANYAYSVAKDTIPDNTTPFVQPLEKIQTTRAPPMKQNPIGAGKRNSVHDLMINTISAFFSQIFAILSSLFTKILITSQDLTTKLKRIRQFIRPFKQPGWLGTCPWVTPSL